MFSYVLDYIVVDVYSSDTLVGGCDRCCRIVLAPCNRVNIAFSTESMEDHYESCNMLFIVWVCASGRPRA